MATTGHDPLGDVLALLRPRAALAAELRGHGRWNLSFDSDPGVKFGVVIEGRCLIGVRGQSAKTFDTGDVFLLGGAPPFVVASDLAAPSRRAGHMLRPAEKRIVEVGSRRALPVVHLIGGRFDLESTHAHLLVKAVPALVRIPAEEASSLRAVTRLLVDEARSSAQGRLRAVDQLSQLVLTYALRWLDSRGESPARRGWLRALSDPRIASALGHIHANVEAGTSLAALARVAGMSRTAFAARFKALVGTSPGDYAIQWRMELAKNGLRTTNRPIGALAFELGYQSESAFSMAFRREVGLSPRAYRRRELSRVHGDV